jgi:hypothetical protein
MSLTQKPESGLKLTEVVHFHSTTEPWKKLDVDDRFSKFHSKFWGKGMVDEEREWLNLKTQSLDHSTDDDVMMDDVYDEEIDDTDVDTDAGEDEDDEFIPGCFCSKRSPTMPCTRTNMLSIAPK